MVLHYSDTYLFYLKIAIYPEQYPRRILLLSVEATNWPDYELMLIQNCGGQYLIWMKLAIPRSKEVFLEYLLYQRLHSSLQSQINTAYKKILSEYDKCM